MAMGAATTALRWTWSWACPCPPHPSERDGDGDEAVAVRACCLPQLCQPDGDDALANTVLFVIVKTVCKH
jgi:hypothetical protein